MIALSGLLFALAVWVGAARRADGRLHGHSRTERRPRPSPWSSRRVQLGVSIGLGGASVLVLGLPLGVLGALASVTLLPRWFARLEPAARRRRRQALSRQAPIVADLLAATLASGAGVRASVGAVADAVGEPGRSALRPVVLALELGADPADAWSLADDDGLLDPITTSVQRADRSGAALADVLAAVAEDLRREQRRVVDVAARAAGVRAVAPLAACFLPAFLLLGVVPVVVALASTVVGASQAS